MNDTTAPQPTKARAWIAMGAALAFVVCFASAVIGLTLKLGPAGGTRGGAVGPESVPLPQPMLGFAIPDFTLIDQDGAAVDQTIFDGRYSIVAFVFTNCPFVCPAMTGNLIRLQDKFLSEPVRIVCISVDPVHDTPARLKEHAERFVADFRFWTYLTGDQETVRRICVEGLKLGLQEEANNPVRTSTGQTMNNILHPSKFILIGPQREVLGMYDGNQEKGADALAADLARLLDKRPPRRSGG